MPRVTQCERNERCKPTAYMRKTRNEFWHQRDCFKLLPTIRYQLCCLLNIPQAVSITAGVRARVLRGTHARTLACSPTCWPVSACRAYNKHARIPFDFIGGFSSKIIENIMFFTSFLMKTPSLKISVPLSKLQPRSTPTLMKGSINTLIATSFTYWLPISILITLK